MGSQKKRIEQVQQDRMTEHLRLEVRDCFPHVRRKIAKPIVQRALGTGTCPIGEGVHCSPSLQDVCRSFQMTRGDQFQLSQAVDLTQALQDHHRGAIDTEADLTNYTHKIRRLGPGPNGRRGGAVNISRERAKYGC